jgi:homoserine O-acetyltransferase/O-succinyltransferase
MKIMRKVLTALLAIALSGIAVGAGVVQAGAEPQVAPQAPASATRSTSTPAINPRNEDVTYTNYAFRDGQTLPQLRLHYALLGTPHYNRNGAIDNAILLLHWTEASSQNLLTQEFQEALFAPGAPFDITRYFVIIPDDIGHGQSSKPSDGLKTGFPQYGYGDMVDLQHKLVTETLGISHLHAVVGMSMGCMNAWQWAEEYPDAMDGVMPIACFPAPISGRNLLWRHITVDGIKSDPAYDGGNYQQEPPSLAEAVNVSQLMINGVPNLQAQITSPAVADGFVNNVDSAAAGYDANNWIYAFQASSDFNAEPELSGIKAKVFAVNFADDEFYRDSLHILEKDMPKVANGRYVIVPSSSATLGHLSMAHPDLWRADAATFMNWLNS